MCAKCCSLLKFVAIREWRFVGGITSDRALVFSFCCAGRSVAPSGVRLRPISVHVRPYAAYTFMYYAYRPNSVSYGESVGGGMSSRDDSAVALLPELDRDAEAHGPLQLAAALGHACLARRRRARAALKDAPRRTSRWREVM